MPLPPAAPLSGSSTSTTRSTPKSKPVAKKSPAVKPGAKKATSKAKKATAKKTVKKAPAKKTAKKAAPAKRTAAKKAPVKKAPTKAAPTRKKAAAKKATVTRSASTATPTRRAVMATKTAAQILREATASSKKTANLKRDAAEFTEALDGTSDPLIRQRILDNVPDAGKPHMQEHFATDGTAIAGGAPGTTSTTTTAAGLIKVVHKDGTEESVNQAQLDDGLKTIVAVQVGDHSMKLPDGTIVPKADAVAELQRQLNKSGANPGTGLKSKAKNLLAKLNS